jgi:cytidine deaminase
MADIFVRSARGGSCRDDIHRAIDLLFGKPFVTPTRDEQAMFHAMAAALRSADGGRQVGAVITTADGAVLVTGTNDVPKPGGGQYWFGDRPDHRDFTLGRDTNERLTLRLVADILDRLKASGWLSRERRALGRRRLLEEALAPPRPGAAEAGPLAKARVTDILEFSRVVHAEMAAVCEAARRGVVIGGSTMYTTTFPCHLCARLVIAAGIHRVVYIDPYAKSLVPELFRDQVTITDEVDEADQAKVIFAGFTGIAPRLFDTVFRATGRVKDAEGRYVPWSPSTASPRTAEGDTMADADTLESVVLAELDIKRASVQGRRRRV